MSGKVKWALEMSFATLLVAGTFVGLERPVAVTLLFAGVSLWLMLLALVLTLARRS